VIEDSGSVTRQLAESGLGVKGQGGRVTIGRLQVHAACSGRAEPVKKLAEQRLAGAAPLEVGCHGHV